MSLRVDEAVPAVEPGLTFDEAKHEYRYLGQTVPHVTAILKDLTSYDMVPPAQLELARQKGVAVHRMVELWAKNEIDLSTLPEWLWPVLEHWENFVAQSGLVVLASEQRVYHRSVGYAGTLDLECTLRGLPGIGILDIKRSFFAGAAIGLQTAAYEAARISETKRKPGWRAALRLREDGAPKLQFYEDRNDFGVFLACLTRHNWIRRTAG